MQIKSFIFYIILIFLAGGCYFDKEDLLYGDEVCDTNMVSFKEDIFPIIRGNCAISGCHVQGGNGNGIYENYDQIKVKVDKGALRQRLLVQRDMPPSGPLSDCMLEHIRQWIEDGAPDN